MLISLPVIFMLSIFLCFPTALERAKAIKLQADQVFNRTIIIHDDISDVVDRLYDLQNNSRFSQTDSQEALDIIGRFVRPFRIVVG